MNVASEFGAKYAAAEHLGVMALDMLASAEPEVQADLEPRRRRRYPECRRRQPHSSALMMVGECEN
jgi:hypothetical protein